MTSSETIVCKPTPWFLLRAVVMLLMFGVFSVLFYLDGATGYRKKNEGYFLKKTFQDANTKFSEMNANGRLTAAEWKAYAGQQSVKFSAGNEPENPSILPADIKLPMPWPAILHDFDRMKSLQWNIPWLEYSKERGLASSPPEEHYTAQKIREQWIVFGLCSVLSLIAAFILLRTLRRTISVDAGAVTTQTGKRVPYGDLKKLDLRKWETKGLAFIDYDGASGRGRIRIDGLTYGGFKKEQNEPAERLMKQIRAHFSGEIIEYANPAESPAGDEESKPG
jgi:hypothetical protein